MPVMNYVDATTPSASRQAPGSLLIRGGTIVTLGEKNRVLENHGILIENGRVSKIAPLASFHDATAQTIDARGKLVMPGLINAHMHFYSTFARGLGKAAPSSDFNEVLKNLWWRLDRKLSSEDVYYSALVALIDSIRKGTTTVIDHHSSPTATRGSLGRIAQAALETGLRACLCYEVSDRAGPQAAKDGIAENVDFIRHCQENGSDKLRALFGLHASFTLSERTLEKAADEAARLKTGFHVHTAEAESDQRHCIENFGVRVIERFRRAGLLGPKTICAHCVHIDDMEMGLLAESGTRVVHNPQSNMNNAVGIADLIKMSAKGVVAGLGTDAMTSNMLEELRAALWLQRLGSQNPSAGFNEVLSALLTANARIADAYWGGLGLGRIEQGTAADIILVDYLPPTPLSTETFAGHLFFGVAESVVDTTIVGGRVLMKNKRLELGLDEEQIAVRASELAAKLWERF